MRDLQATFGELDIDARAWEVRRGGTVIDLTRTEFEILALLASRPREVVTDEEITREIWGDGWFGDENNLAVHVSKLRRKLGESGLKPRFIRTVRGVGYRFDPGPRDDLAPASDEATCDSLRGQDGAVEVQADGDLRVVSVWPQGATVLGFDPGDLLGSVLPVITDYPWIDNESAHDAARSLVRDGVREWVARHVVRRADGRVVSADCATCIVVDRDGGLESVRLVVVEREWDGNGGVGGGVVGGGGEGGGGGGGGGGVRHR
jgi:DNA-binding winged helix-turn-helix (wHTH) protein